MIYLTWGMKDPRVVYGNPNLRWGSPSYLLEPGDEGYVALQPGQPGYVPPAPKPARKRRRAGTSSLLNTTQPQTTAAPPMSFQIVILPNPQNPQRPFRARAKLGTQVAENEYLDAIVTDAADPAITRAVVEKVIRSMFKVMVGFLRQTRPIGYVLGLFRALPTITGSFTTNEPSAEELKAGIDAAINAGPQLDAALTDGLSTEIVEEVGLVRPRIDNIMLSPGGQVDKYSTTAAFKVSGDNFRGSGQGQPWCTAWLVDDAGANPVALTVFSCSQTELLISPVAAGTTGTRRLKIVAGWDTDLTDTSGPLTLQS